ncbi:MAG: hypothetical protein WBB37_10560 [bacterium]
MKKTNILLCLEKFCRNLSIVVKYDKFFGRGGFCRLRDQSYFIINERLSNDAKEQLFVDGLNGYNFAALEIPLQLKDILNIPDEKQ